VVCLPWMDGKKQKGSKSGKRTKVFPLAMVIPFTSYYSWTSFHLCHTFRCLAPEIELFFLLTVCSALFYHNHFYAVLFSAFCGALWESYQLPIYIRKAIMEATKLSFPNLWNYIRFVILPLCYYRFLLSLYCPLILTSD
jgi:hypothetical protein